MRISNFVSAAPNFSIKGYLMGVESALTKWMSKKEITAKEKTAAKKIKEFVSKELASLL